MKVVNIGLLLLTLNACRSSEIYEKHYDRPEAQSPAEIEFVKATLSNLQTISIAENREYCGYIILTTSGEYKASPPKRGRKGYCVTKDLGEDVQILASYHTHGAYSERFESELPSSDDLLSDIEEAVDGYIATPGGRIWYNDATTETSALLCADCITADPNYDPLDIPDIQQKYTLDELFDVEDG